MSYLISPKVNAPLVPGGGGSSGPTVHTLTAIDNIPTGAADGDVGLYDAGDGVRTYVLDTIPISDDAGGGTFRLWLPPDVEAGTPEVIGYFDGTEDNTALANQGNAVTGTVATDTGEILLTATGPSAFSFLTQSTTVATADRYYMRGLYRGATTGSDSQLFVHRATDGGASDYMATGQATGGEDLSFLTTLNVKVGLVYREPAESLPGLTATAALVETVHYGMTVLTELWRDGGLVASYRGDQQTAPSDSVIAPFARANAAASTSTLRASKQVVIKW